MNKVIIYCFLLLLYLTLSKSLSPSEMGISYVNSNENLDRLIPGTPVTAILTDIHSTGFLIKTYYLKYKIIHGFQSFEELIVRTSRSYKDKHKNFIGLSVFRRFKVGGIETVDYTPLPPGSVFVGDKNFGNWIPHDSGDRVWKFFRVYRQIPTYLGWGNFLPTYSSFAKSQVYMKQNKPYFGINNQFGTQGELTKKFFPDYYSRLAPSSVNWKKFIENYFKNNFISARINNE
jgi:hypothetical protein